MSNVKPLGTLFNESVEFLQKHLTAVLVGAVIFGVASQSIGLFLVGSGAATGLNMGGWQQQMEKTGKKMQELQQRAMDGTMDDASQQEMERLAKQLTEQSMQGAGMMTAVFVKMLPAIGMSLLFSILLMLLAKSYFMVVAVRGIKDPVAALQSTVGSIMPLVGLWVWLFLRSFIWIPIVGIVIAIIVGPRFILSPLYLLEQKKGVMDSARMSYGKTNGYWAKIIGNALAIGIVTMICSGILSKIAMGILGGMVGGFVAAAIGQFAAAFIVIFMIHLARTVMTNSKA